MPTILLSLLSGATAEIHLNGAQVTSWRPRNGAEVLFLSRCSHFAPGIGIRGGIPVIFPQFGPGPLPHHGFARTETWELSDSGTVESSESFVRLVLKDSANTRRVWPHRFTAELLVQLGDDLVVELAITNEDSTPFVFTAALHNYFAVADISRTRVAELRDTRYRDKVRGGIEAVDEEEWLTPTSETDRIYIDPPEELRIEDRGRARTISVRRTGFRDAVVWNPWIRWSREHDDFGDDEYLEMICLEPARIAEPVELAPGEKWMGRQFLGVDTTSTFERG